MEIEELGVLFAGLFPSSNFVDCTGNKPDSQSKHYKKNPSSKAAKRIHFIAFRAHENMKQKCIFIALQAKFFAKKNETTVKMLKQLE